jgi:hypothetical protein
MLPALSSKGLLDLAKSGPDLVQGFARDGHRLFAVSFEDSGYSYYVFAPVARERLGSLYRLTITAHGKTISQTASNHGPAAALSVARGDKVEIRWNATAFPRLSCTGERGGSPAPLMLGGTFTAANVYGRALECDFSDGVKTAFASIRIPIAGR